MKKLVLLISLVSLLFGTRLPAAIAENKYEGMTFEQLQTEYLAILQAMWKTDKWQEVEVPAGTYQIGVEIPAGEWTIMSDSDPIITVGTKLNATKTDIDWDGLLTSEYVEKDKFPNGWTVKLSTEQFIVIDEIVFFTVPVKGQGFTFK